MLMLVGTDGSGYNSYHMRKRPFSPLSVRKEFWLQLVVYLVGIHGLYVVAITLLDQLSAHPGGHLSAIDVDIPLLIGFGFVYLASLLRRRKQMAWAVAVGAYIFMIGFYANQIEGAIDHRDWLQVVSKLGLPLINITLLWLSRRAFTVRSDIQSFRYSLRFIALILLAAFIYGTAGFMLMDKHDFHHEITLGEAAHRTLDQFGLTTDNGLVPHTRRARLFVDSLSVVSVAAVSYAAISLFQPIRARYTHHEDGLSKARELLVAQNGTSEDFFKVWPHDKTYFFDASGSAGLAYRVQGGVALVVGDPFGSRAKAAKLLHGFEDLCYGNDWQPVFVHTEPQWNEFYTRHGYSVQKLGEEAVVDLEHFLRDVHGNKYFRQIRNRFQREDMTAEVLSPPHNKAVVNRLRLISEAWLDRPGRSERGFAMGYFSEEYLQQCPVVVARDAAGTIQAFLNQIPSFDPDEANFDMLRTSNEAPGNVNDFLLMAFIDHLHAEGIKRLNLGLCPLAGLDDLEEKSVISRSLEFVYSNGDRFYSFSGLTRFKAKYEPSWSDRYIVYKGGLRTFVKAMNALPRAMRVKIKD